MRLLTAEGMRNIDDALIICTNRPRTVAEHLLVTVFLLTGEQVTGVVDVAKPAEFTELPLWPRDTVRFAPEADIRQRGLHVRYVPEADIPISYHCER